MKIKTTEKQIKGVFNNIISIGYCDAWYLLKHREPLMYTSGVYGWNADIYVINNDTCIVTGYRPFGNLKIDAISKLNKKARDYYDKYDYKKADALCEKLLNKTIEKIIHVE